MELKKTAAAGTMESGDILITIEPRTEGGVTLELSSSVLQQYGRQIEAVIRETLAGLEIPHAAVRAVDKGALDCTLKARVECAVFRSCDQSEENIPWGGAVR